MESYTTQMDAAKRGIITPEMERVAQDEHYSIEEILSLVAKGQVVICKNKLHKCLNPVGIGSMLRTKINVNLGISRDCKDYDEEMKKVMLSVKMGADAIMDLSSHGDTRPFRQKLIRECPVAVGTVPVYDGVLHYKRDLETLTAKDFIDVVRMHAEEGVDFITLHAGITRDTIKQIKNHKRKINIVSRGGSLIFAWMSMTGEENPFYSHFDDILDICRQYDVTLSLGDACRPGCLADSSDICQIDELVRLGELTKRAWAKDVQVIIEGPGHMPLDQIEANMKIQQTICMGAPFYVLGPLVTDIAPGYDHITAAIGGAVAASCGAAFVIKGLMALMAFYTYKFLKDKLKEMPSRIISGIISEIFMVLGYLLFESCLYGFVPSLINVPANLVQGVAGLLFGTVLIRIFEKNRIFI